MRATRSTRAMQYLRSIAIACIRGASKHTPCKRTFLGDVAVRVRRACKQGQGWEAVKLTEACEDDMLMHQTLPAKTYIDVRAGRSHCGVRNERGGRFFKVFNLKAACEVLKQNPPSTSMHQK
eukprot:1633104-Pleurochrysis_carterae.AAC.1